MRARASLMQRILRRSLPLLAIISLAPAVLAGDIFVDAGSTTGANDGSSWANAHQGAQGLVAALAQSTSGDRVFVAEGTYLPSATGNRNSSFTLSNGVEILGGFVGTESSPDERPSIGSAPSILSADLNGDDAMNLFNDNAYHVVRSTGNQSSAVLDRFTVRGGNANSGGNNDRGGGILCLSSTRATVRDCHFIDNRCTFGGGAGYVNGAPTFIGCTFTNNRGGNFGGAFDIAFSGAVRFDRCHFEGNSASRAGALEFFSTGGPVISNSTFVGNTATGGSGGGAIWSSGTSLRIRNCTVIGNRATAQAGGGATIAGGSVSIANCIFWDNMGPGGAQAFGNQVSGLSTAAITYSIIEGVTTGTGNLNVDPGLVDLAGGDYRLPVTSPAIDAGNSSAVIAAPLGGIAVDFDAASRFFDEPTVIDTGVGPGPVVDIGAFEYTTLLGSPYCVATGTSNGLAATLEASGSTVVAANNVTLTARQLPANTFGFFLTSRTSGFVAFAGGSAGNLCLGGAIGRYVGPGQINSSGASGTLTLSLDLASHPQPSGLIAVQAGETWRFQAWFRDSVLGFPTSNFTSGLAITFE